ncbi:ATP-dependent zinc metalloprotease yme1l [Polyplax serrata]|uniref:ATP-dependent zinc metalloprotease yme1l n=1 Tax=Polyplax serrata TaxID=468196 RepID=A0ABR1ANP6_POLSC
MFRNVGLQHHRHGILRAYHRSHCLNRVKTEKSLKWPTVRCKQSIQSYQISTGEYGKSTEVVGDDSRSLHKGPSTWKAVEVFLSSHKYLGPSRIGNKQIPFLLPLEGQAQVKRHFSTGTDESGQPKKTGLITRILNLFKLQVFKSKTDQKLKKGKNDLLEDASTAEEAEKLKVAFTDGYLAATKHIRDPKPPSKFMRIVTPIMSLFVVSGMLICLVILVSGTFFRSQIGKYTEINQEEIHVTFQDVKGAQEAKQELKEIVAFLKNPERFSVLGGKLPKGVLLVGPPGTGKTLLARAVAGEAKVPFFHVAGPEFDEVLVGQGARRVRDLFKAAKEAAPCVIFIDEIDSVGSKRTNSMLHPYANQTINQLLSEMDGFHQNEGVVVLGATNRRNDLDKALLRPGRFDVEVVVPIPDYAERREIIQYYIGKVLAKDVDVEMLARGTVGFTGADLENMVNQAALRAAIDGADGITMPYLENAKDKLLMGPERKSRIPDDETNLITAYHEGGHTIVCFYTPDSKPLHKVTILPRGRSLGHTSFLPEKEQYLVKKSQLLATMDTLMGGRAAEELIFGPDKITTGASNDLKEATSIATHMVKEWGMSEKVGLRTVDVNQRSSEAVEAEISWLLQESYKRARTIIKNYSRELKLLVEALLKYETLDADDVKAILMERRKN